MTKEKIMETALMMMYERNAYEEEAETDREMALAREYCRGIIEYARELAFQAGEEEAT